MGGCVARQHLNVKFISDNIIIYFSVFVYFVVCKRLQTIWWVIIIGSVVYADKGYSYYNKYYLELWFHSDAFSGAFSFWYILNVDLFGANL